ncbi:MAG: hypothetical protein FJ026_09755 [Chloroflexi bacterium]|nr:hypothetical protein [Chloroflexota bacterium]
MSGVRLRDNPRYPDAYARMVALLRDGRQCRVVEIARQLGHPRKLVEGIVRHCPATFAVIDADRKTAGGRLVRLAESLIEWPDWRQRLERQRRNERRALALCATVTE